MIRRLLPAHADEAPSSSWAPLYVRGDFYDVAWSGSLYVVVGASGIVLTSPDGDAWTVQASGVTADLHAVVWGAEASVFIAVGAGGVVLTSGDGVSWVAQTSVVKQDLFGNVARLHSVAWSGTLFTAVGDQALLATSPNGVDWTTIDISETSNTFTEVIWDGSRFIAIAVGSIWMTSVDGVTWAFGYTNITGSWYGLTWTGAQYVLVGSSGRVATSPTGAFWTLKTSSTTASMVGVAWSGSLYVAVTTSGFSQRMMTSPDSNTWTESGLDDSFTEFLRRVRWVNSRFVAVGRSQLFLSEDGSTWVSKVSGPNSNVNSIAHTSYNLEFIAVGRGGQVSTSPDGVVWTRQVSGVSRDTHLYSAIAVGTHVVAVGRTGAILVSTNGGVGWTSYSVVTNRTFEGVAYSPSEGVYVAVATAGVIYRSVPNFSYTMWDAQISGTTEWLRDVTWASGLGAFVAVGNSTLVITSPTGVAWTPRPTGLPSTTLFGVAANSSRVVIVGSSGRVATSEDGVEWTLRDSQTTESLTTVVWTGPSLGFVAVGANATVLTSPDGITWTIEPLDLPVIPASQYYLSCFATDGWHKVIGAPHGQIIRSPATATPVL